VKSHPLGSWNPGMMHGVDAAPCLHRTLEVGFLAEIGPRTSNFAESKVPVGYLPNILLASTCGVGFASERRCES